MAKKGDQLIERTKMKPLAHYGTWPPNDQPGALKSEIAFSKMNGSKDSYAVAVTQQLDSLFEFQKSRERVRAAIFRWQQP
jgi:hypothetical protein